MYEIEEVLNFESYLFQSAECPIGETHDAPAGVSSEGVGMALVGDEGLFEGSWRSCYGRSELLYWISIRLATPLAMDAGHSSQLSSGSGELLR